MRVWPNDFVNQIILGDCLDVMQEIPDWAIDAIITDLPQNITQNSWDSIIPFDLLWKSVFRVLAPGGVFITTSNQPFTSALVMSNLKWYKHEWIWIKNRGSNFANTIREPFKEHESVLVFSGGNWTYNKQMQERSGGGLERSKYNVKYQTSSDNYRQFDTRPQNKLDKLRVPSSWQKFSTETGLHPTQKPVALFEYMIKTYTHSGDLVLDITAGAGTTAIACINTGRRYICIEKDGHYYEIAKKRIEDHAKTLAG